MNTEQSVSNLLNGNTDERQNAAENLVKTDARLAAYSLIHALEGVSEEKQTKALGSLTQVGVAAVPLLVEVLKSNNAPLSQLGSDALVKTGAPAVEAVIACLDDGDSNMRRTAAETLGNIGDPQAVRPLIRVLETHPYSERAGEIFGDWDAYVCRAAAVRALVKLKDPQAIPVLIRGLKDSFLCGEILDCLEKMRFDDTSVGLLLSAVEDGNQISERYILDKLKQIGPAAADTLLDALKSPNQSQQLAAARALAAIKDIRAIEPLLDSVQQRENDIPWDTIGALAGIGLPAIQLLLNCQCWFGIPQNR